MLNRISPAASHIIRSKNIDPSSVKATGRNGALVTKGDVLNAIGDQTISFVDPVELSLPVARPAFLDVRSAIRTAMEEEIERDSRVFLMGEEVAQYDGAYKVSKGMWQKYGDSRIIDTPITEMGFAGVGVGAALNGMRPIVEFMTFNFAMQGIDHIVNSAGKIHYMSGGTISCPIVFRGLNGVALAVAAQHSQDFTPWYANVPGLKVIVPYDTEDHRGLLKAAIRDPDPVVFLECELMYSVEFPTTAAMMDPDFVVPIGKGKYMRKGNDVTLTAYGRMVGVCVEAGDILEKQHGIHADVINLRTVRPLDRDILIESVTKTHNIVSVEESWPQGGIGAEISALLFETSAFNQLDSPLSRVTGIDVPAPYARKLEEQCTPVAQDVVDAVLKQRGLL